MNLKKLTEITPALREKILKVIDNDSRVTPITFHIYKHYKKNEVLFDFMIENKITGKNFIDFIKFEHCNSPLLAINEIHRRIFRDKNYCVRLGVDFLER